MIRNPIAQLFWASILFFPATGFADTIFLKNGAWIDGVITYRNEDTLELEIGKIGKLRVPMEEVYLIEKNKRTGAESSTTYVDPIGTQEYVEDKNKVDAADKLDELESQEELDDLEIEEKIASEDSDPSHHDSIFEYEDEEIAPELQERIEELVEELQRHKARRRVRAERHLKAIGKPSVRYLLPLAKHEQELTRVAVLRLFYAFGDERVVQACIDALVDSNEYVREYADKALKRITGEEFRYAPFGSPRRREQGQKKWASWWRKELQELAKHRK